MQGRWFPDCDGNYKFSFRLQKASDRFQLLVPLDPVRHVLHPMHPRPFTQCVWAPSRYFWCSFQALPKFQKQNFQKGKIIYWLSRKTGKKTITSLYLRWGNWWYIIKGWINADCIQVVRYHGLRLLILYQKSKKKEECPRWGQRLKNSADSGFSKW